MSGVPPFIPDDGVEWENWREETSRLDYPDRDIRKIFPEEHRSTLYRQEFQPADFGDFDPEPDDPDPDVWPLEELDPGYPAEIDDLTLLQNTFPAPHVAWVTEEYLEARYRYNPLRQEVRADEIPEWYRPEGVGDHSTVEIDATNDYNKSMTLTNERREALNRMARLWNGERVQGHHLLLDKCPDWMDIFGDLDQGELERFVVDPDTKPELLAAFGEYDWFQPEFTVYFEPKRILRKKVWYSPTLSGKTLINKNSDFPNLNGDLNEKLPHRFTVGLTALREVSRDRRLNTYYEVEGYTVDVISQDENEEIYVGEVITGHNNWVHHRDTYKKLRDLNRPGVTPYVVFEGRDTAYDIFNFWHRKGLAELPRGVFASDFAIPDGRKRIQEAYENNQYEWDVSDWTTTEHLWRNTLGPNGPGINHDEVMSLPW